MEVATFAGGCFWCFEAVFKRIKGVEGAVSGYAGGKMDNPNYEAVSSGNTGHAEAVQITFDPKIISYEKLTEVFFALHDPTTENRQGNDVGDQYRSVIFYHSEEQKEIAEKEMKKCGQKYADPIITEIIPFKEFFKAEDYHQNYYEQNKNSNPYCRLVIDPKITKLYKNFKNLTK